MATIQQQQWDGSTVYTLENSNFSLSLIPEIGSNVYRLWDKIAGRDVLRVPDSVEALRLKPVHFGIPILLPPSRIRNGTFPFNGKTYQFEKNTPDGHHIHGFVRHRPWRVTDTTTDGDSASITTEFRSADFPELAAEYPHDLTIRLHTEIREASLVQTFAIRNGSDEPAPFGFGLHTWFMLDGEPESWTLQFPVADIWELNEKLLATGNRLPLGRYERLNEGLNLQGQDMDMAFRIGDRPAEAVLSKPGYAIRYRGNEPFTQWVVYTKGQARDTICIEPLTWTPDAPNLDAPSDLTGMRAIGPGDELELKLALDIERSQRERN
jgi:aldose 1-epimerase